MNVLAIDLQRTDFHLGSHGFTKKMLPQTNGNGIMANFAHGLLVREHFRSARYGMPVAGNDAIRAEEVEFDDADEVERGLFW